MTRRRPEHFHIHQLKRTYNRETSTFTININYETAPTILTQRTKEVAEAFGLGTDKTRQFTLFDNVNIHIKPTDIVLITGDSGSGKSALLKAIKQDLATEAQDTKDLKINHDQPIIETLGNNTTQAIQALSQVGLNDAFLFLRPYKQLSDGQKHRYQIALLAAQQKPFWLLDEFTSTLDRDTAKIVAYNLQKLARKMGKAVIAATTQKDLLKDFAPNVHIHKRYGKEVTIKYHPKAKAKKCTITKQITIQEGTKQDYKTLSQFHYRTTRLPPTRKIFTLKHKNQLCGIITYSYPTPTSFGRSKIWKGNIKELFAQFSAITRVIIHPKYRSIGLGQKIVHDTLPQAGIPHIETVAVMAKYNPFFEKAGMQKITQNTPSKHIQTALQELEKLGFDTMLMASENYNQQKIQQTNIQQIKTILTNLSKHDSTIRRKLAPTKNIYPKHQEFTQKIQTQNTTQLAQTLKKLSFTNQTKTYLHYTQKNQSSGGPLRFDAQNPPSPQALHSYPHPLERTTSKLRLLSPEPSQIRLLNDETAPLRKQPTDRQPQRTDTQRFGNEDPSGHERLIRRCQPVM